MKTGKKALLMTLCAVMLVVASVMGTMAYLTDTASVTNTFTVGKVEITLDEAPVNDMGVVVEGDRGTKNNYKLLPGHEYTKDPTIHVDKDSEDCWLFVKVEDGLAAIEDTETIAAQMEKNGWTAVEDIGVYAYKDIVTKAADDKDIEVFGTFKIKGNADVSTYGKAEIIVTAYAVQADGFGSAAEAWRAAEFN